MLLPPAEFHEVRLTATREFPTQACDSLLLDHNVSAVNRANLDVRSLVGDGGEIEGADDVVAASHLCPINSDRNHQGRRRTSGQGLRISGHVIQPAAVHAQRVDGELAGGAGCRSGSKPATATALALATRESGSEDEDDGEVANESGEVEHGASWALWVFRPDLRVVPEDRDWYFLCITATN